MQANSFSRRDFLGQTGRFALMMGSAPTILSLVGCGGSGSSLAGPIQRSISAEWTITMLEAISSIKPGPPMTARAIGMVSTAIFDAWAAYDEVALATLLGGTLRRPSMEHTPQNKTVAISYAAYRVLLDLYPSEKIRFDQKMSQLGLSVDNLSESKVTPIGIGNLVASELLKFRHGDGSNQLNNYADTTGYVPTNTPDNVVDPSKWQQLKFDNGKSPGYVAPHWGNVVPFALASGSSIRPLPPPSFGSPTYLDQVREVVDILGRLNDERKSIAEYWADGPGSVLPPGHWQTFALVISQRDGHTLDQDVKLFFMLGNAVLDASIACWDCKRTYNTSRPITAIRSLLKEETIPTFAGSTLGIRADLGSNWYPYQSRNFITPPFPEYISGHSTFSSASAEILRRFTGSDAFGHSVTIPAHSSSFEANIPDSAVTLQWDSFSAAAEQAGISRLYGGIHFREANQEGQKCGLAVADTVWNACMSYVDGSARSRLP